MMCSIDGCPGEYEHRDVVRAIDRGDGIIVVEHIPADVCPVCGDVLFAPDTIERLEELRRTAISPVGTVPLYEFAQLVS